MIGRDGSYITYPLNNFATEQCWYVMVWHVKGTPYYSRSLYHDMSRHAGFLGPLMYET